MDTVPEGAKQLKGRSNQDATLTALRRVNRQECIPQERHRCCRMQSGATWCKLPGCTTTAAGAAAGFARQTLCASLCRSFDYFRQPLQVPGAGRDAVREERSTPLLGCTSSAPRHMSCQVNSTTTYVSFLSAPISPHSFRALGAPRSPWTRTVNRGKGLLCNTVACLEQKE
eukprot:1161078-Pelagomonas_calceolata.AAC.2